MCPDIVIRRFAGSFILVSVALGWFVHPGWFAFTALRGAEPAAIQHHRLLSAGADAGGGAVVRLHATVACTPASPGARVSVRR